jgi:hypothetical protein
MDCGGGMNDGVWYTFTPTVGGALDLVLTTSWDSEIAVYSGSCGVFTCVDYVAHILCKFLSTIQ